MIERPGRFCSAWLPMSPWGSDYIFTDTWFRVRRIASEDSELSRAQSFLLIVRTDRIVTNRSISSFAHHGRNATSTRERMQLVATDTRGFQHLAEFIDSAFMSTVSRRSKPSSRAALMGEQPNPWDLLRPQDATSRHRTLSTISSGADYISTLPDQRRGVGVLRRP